jgi:hypothetical protein
MTQLKSVLERAVNDSMSSDEDEDKDGDEETTAILGSLRESGELSEGPTLRGPDLSGIVDSDDDSSAVGEAFCGGGSGQTVSWLQEPGFSVISGAGCEGVSESDSMSDDAGKEEDGESESESESESDGENEARRREAIAALNRFIPPM